MDYTDEQKMIRDTVRKLAREKIEPMVEDLEAEGKGSGIARDILAENGLLKLALPQEYGGIDANFTTVALVIEELAKVDAGISMNVFTSNTVNFFVNLFASEEQKPKFYSILKERVGGAFCLTEPGYGSDAANITMKGVYQDGYYIINGVKTMASDGPVADSFIVYVRTGPGEKARGVSCFFMEKLPGIFAGKPFDKLGFRTSPTSELFFENVKAPREYLLGGEGKGWNTLVYGGGAMRAFGASSQALGTAEGAMEYAIKYAKERISFGRPIIQHQAIMFMIAEMGIKIEAARSLHARTLQMIDRGNYSQAEYQLLTSATKCFVCDMAMEVTTDAVQVLGAYGAMNEYPVARRMRDAKVNQIFDGTSQIQKLIIGRTLAEMY